MGVLTSSPEVALHLTVDDPSSPCGRSTTWRVLYAHSLGFRVAVRIGRGCLWMRAVRESTEGSRLLYKNAEQPSELGTSGESASSTDMRRGRRRRATDSEQQRARAKTSSVETDSCPFSSLYRRAVLSRYTRLCPIFRRRPNSKASREMGDGPNSLSYTVTRSIAHTSLK